MGISCIGAKARWERSLFETESAKVSFVPTAQGRIRRDEDDIVSTEESAAGAIFGIDPRPLDSPGAPATGKILIRR